MIFKNEQLFDDLFQYIKETNCLENIDIDEIDGNYFKTFIKNSFSKFY